MNDKTNLADLLDHWSPPQDANSEVKAGNIVPIGFVSTSFTFDVDFFDECLTSFLGMETEKEKDGAAFLIEREGKLAGLKAGIVLVDQHHCKGDRSLRWDLVPCRVKNGIMHAKVTLLHWSHCIRLIVSSANLTQNGYCINQEIFGVIDYSENSQSDLRIIREVADFLGKMADIHCGVVVKDRFQTFIKGINDTLRKWNIQEKQYGKDDIALRTLLISPVSRDGLKGLRNVWDEHFPSPPDQAFVTSPFFDDCESLTGPSVQLPEILKLRGEVDITYQLTTEPISAESDRFVANGPFYLQNPPRPSCSITFARIEEKNLVENGKKILFRPLHLKTIWLQNGDMHLLMAGSSNFTSAAFGLGRRVNYEANLVYIVNSSRNKKGYQSLVDGHLDGEIFEASEAKFRERPNEDEAGAADELTLLPDFFGEAIIRADKDRFVLRLIFCGDKPVAPPNFEISHEKAGQVYSILKQATWELSGQSAKFDIEWSELPVPDQLRVTWEGVTMPAIWPVIAENQLTLPPVETLRNLSLDALLYILSSTQPLHRLLKVLEQMRRPEIESEDASPVLDAHKLVDTSGFLLQRTRRVSYAMRALAGRLERPVFTRESLEWRLYGPVGVQSLINAVNREAKSVEEKNFLLSELALELSRVKPDVTETSLKAREVKDEIGAIVRNLASALSKQSIGDPAIGSYTAEALKKALHEF